MFNFTTVDGMFYAKTFHYTKYVTELQICLKYKCNLIWIKLRLPDKLVLTCLNWCKPACAFSMFQQMKQMVHIVL